MKRRAPALIALGIVLVASAVSLFGSQVRSVELLALLASGFSAGALTVAGVQALRRTD